jgi:hypothetical protein
MADLSCNSGQAGTVEACQQPLGPGDFVIRFLAGAPRPANTARGRVLGESIAARSMGSYINVYPIAVPNTNPKRKAEIIGHTIAHELGHLLLATENHSTDGVMKTNWSERDWQLMEAGSVRFERRQSLEMLRQLELRFNLPRVRLSSQSLFPASSSLSHLTSRWIPLTPRFIEGDPHPPPCANRFNGFSPSLCPRIRFGHPAHRRRRIMEEFLCEPYDHFAVLVCGFT